MAVTQDGSPTPPDAASTGKPQDGNTLARVAGAVLLGSALEWYDYFLYGAAAALVFDQVFFPNQDPSISLLLSFATFGAASWPARWARLSSATWATSTGADRRWWRPWC